MDRHAAGAHRPVVVVGQGPIGDMIAARLADQGVPVITVARSRGTLRCDLTDAADRALMLEAVRATAPSSVVLVHGPSGVAGLGAYRHMTARAGLTAMAAQKPPGAASTAREPGAAPGQAWFGVDAGGTRTVVSSGGHEYLGSDEGSGFDIGLAGLRAACRALDGVAAPTTLAEALAAHLGADPRDAARALAQRPFPKQAVAALAPVVCACWLNDDEVSGRIIGAALLLAEHPRPLRSPPTGAGTLTSERRTC